MKSGSFLQGGGLSQDSMSQVMSALQTVMDASSVNSADKMKVQALLQSSSDDSLSLDQPAGAPEAAAYESHSGGILETLEDMLDKAQAQQAEAQKAEMNAKHNFEMLAQKLKDAIEHEGKELDGAKGDKSAAEEAKATAQGERDMAQKALDEG